MANQEVTLMKGNEAIAHACIRCGADGFFGYPITPQSEIIETLALLKPWETSGMVVLQAESEVAAINMVYGGAGAGKRVITTSSSPGVALMQEGISYMAGSCDRAGSTGRTEFGGCQSCHSKTEKETGIFAKGNQGGKDHCADSAGH
jgi:TPP-dependent indolepyruvate ferredoxin oxidoreductase alpha subunit